MNKIFETPLYPYYQSVDQTASAPAHHSVVVIGAGPVGLGMAIDLAQHGIDVVVLDAVSLTDGVVLLSLLV